MGRPQLNIEAQLDSICNARPVKYQSSALSWSDLFFGYCLEFCECDLIVFFENWLYRTAFVLEGFSGVKEEREEDDRRSTNRVKKFSETSNLRAGSNMEEPKQTHSEPCLLADGTHNIWNCLLFRKVGVNDWHSAVRKQLFYYRCLGK